MKLNASCYAFLLLVYLTTLFSLISLICNNICNVDYSRRLLIL